MKNMREFDDILNECIERIIKGATIDTCLADYPEQAAALEPLLRTAADTIKAAAITPRPEFRQRAGYEFQAALRNLKPEKHGFFRWQARWVAVVSAVIVVLLAGGGTVAASSNSLPDQPLYAVKLATENVRLALTPSALGKASLYAEFADRRVDEIIKMAEKGKVAQVVKSTDRMNDQLLAMANLSLPARETGTGGETPAILMAAPATDAGAPPEVSAPAVTPAPTAAAAPGLRSAPTPVTGPAENVKQPVSSANLSAAKAPEKQAAPADKAAVTARAEKKVKIKSAADLKTTVSEQAEKNTQELQKVLERAPDAVKAALERAIDIAGKGYEEALKNIGPQK
jgi:hypothetical protein